MRFTFITTCCLALFSAVLFSSTIATPANCPPTKTDILLEQCRVMVKDIYSLLSAAILLPKGELHDRYVAEAKELTVIVDRVSWEAYIHLPDDGKFAHKQYLSWRWHKLTSKNDWAKDMISAGVPSWPHLGKALAKIESTWNNIKDKVKGFFKKDDTTVDADTKQKSDAVAQVLIVTITDLEDSANQEILC